MASSSPISGNYDLPPTPATRQVPITTTTLTVQPRRSSGVPHPAQGTNSCMEPTWSGFIHSTWDALVVLEACLSGILHHIPRRPHDRERANIITSGNVFIYEENASGIKRWTDGVTWSPSRIMGNFLVYRELNEPFPAGEKKKAKKRKRGAEETDPVENLNGQSEEDRKLVGSLVDSYGFKPNGLIKKTLNVKYKGVNHHIVSYYSLNDVKAMKCTRPQFDLNIQSIVPRRELMDNQFKAGFDSEDMDPFQESSQQPVVPPSMARPLIAHDNPLNHSSHVSSHVHQPTSLSSLGHPIHQTPLTSAPISLRYHPYPPQHASTYPYMHQPALDFHQDNLHVSGTVANDYYMALPTASNQGAVLDTNLNPTVLETSSSYLYQNTTQANMYSINPSPIITSSPIHQQWNGDLADDFKAPATKRRQTIGSSLAMHSYPNGGFMGSFDQTHGLPYLSEHPSASPVY